MKWEKVKLDSVTDSCLGKMLDQEKNKGDFHPYLANINVRWGEFSLDNLSEMRFEERESDRYGLRYGDLVICEGGEPGRCAIWKEQFPEMRFQKALHRVRVHNCLDYRYLFYWFLLAGKTKELDQYYTGATIKHMPGDKLKSIIIDLPPIDVQRRIADILSAYDDLIENNRKQIKLLEEAAQRLYREWFVDLRFPGWESTPVLDGLPEGWSQRRLIDIAAIVMGQSPESASFNSESIGLPFHQGVGTYGNRFVIDEKYTTSFTRIGEANSILFSVRAPVGRLNITRRKIIIGRGIAAINHKMGYQSYLFYMLKERFFKDNIVGNGSIFASINKEELYSQIFVYPTDGIAEKCNQILQPIDCLIDAIDWQIIQAQQARDALLPKLMSGEIEV